MLRNGRVFAPGLAIGATLALFVASGCASRTAATANGSPATAGESQDVTTAQTSSAPVTLTGATLMAEGDSPRFLLTGTGPLGPTLYTGDDGRRVVIDLPNTVPSPGLEPPRVDGRTFVKVDMKSFVELGKPHVQFELTGLRALDSKLGTEPGTQAMAITFAPRPEANEPNAPVAPAVRMASAAPSSTPARAETIHVETLPTTSEPPEPAAQPAAVAPVKNVASGEPVEVARHAAPARGGTRLETVSARKAASGLVVTLAGNGEFGYEAFVLDNPPRYVLDLTGVKNGAPRRSQDLHAGAVSRVRVSQFKPGTGSDAVTRVVFDLASPARPELVPTATGLRVEFLESPNAAPAATVAAAAPQSVSPAAAPVAAEPPPAPAPTTSPAVSAPASPEPAVAETTAKPGDEGAKPAQVTEATAEKAEKPAGASEAPKNTTSTTEITEAPTPAATPTVVASSEPHAEPAGAPAESTKQSAAVPEVTVATAVPAASSFEKHESEDPQEPVVAAPAQPKAEPAASAPVPVAQKPAPAPPVATLSVTPSEVRAPASAAPQSPRPNRRKASSAEDRALIEAAEAVLVQQEAGGKSRDLQNTYESRTLGAGEKQYTGEPITLNLKDADIKDTLQKFSELTGLNIVIDPDVRGTVTVSLTDIPWDQALELILKINGLGYTLEGNVMRIASTQKLAAEETNRQNLLKAQDQNRPVKTVIQKLSYANGADAAKTAKNVMSARGDIFVDERSNTLIIKELPDYLPTVLDLIKSLDVPTPQVMIEARIVEATRTFSRQLGVNWSFNGVSDQSHGNTTGLVFPNHGSLDGQVALPNGNQILHFTAGNVLDTFRLDMALSAAESRGLVKIISTPKIQTQTNQSAQIQSGFQIPVQTTVNNTTTVLYIDATLRLQVTPQITSEGTVIMDVSVQKREPAVALNVVGGSNVPLTTRDAKTRLMVRDGGTSVIGGIFKLTSNDGASMIPGLWKIPLLGNLFRNKTESQASDELMIFITPRIMKN